MSETITFSCSSPIIQHSTMQKIVALSVTEAELIAATTMAQDMMYAKRLLESFNSRVELQMILEVDNKGTVDLINNHSLGFRTRHMETRQYYLRKLKEQGVMSVKWKADTENSSDLYTKNFARKEFKKQAHGMLINCPGNVTKGECQRQFCDKPGYDMYYVPYAAEKCGYDLLTCGYDQNDNRS